MKPRGWQKRAIKRFEEHTGLSFLLEGTPGCGKTIFSAFCARHLFEHDLIDFAIIAVPNLAIKGDKDAGFLGDWNKVGIQITTVLKDDQGIPSEFRGAVVTYSQLPNLISTIETWAKNGARILMVFDEVHHLVNNGDFKWGPAAESAARVSKKVLAMTGTPFRGDERRISFVKYNSDNNVVPDFRYTYREAVRDRVCREVVFLHDDSITQFISNTTEHTVRLSEVENEDERRGAVRTVFRTDSQWLRIVIEKAEAKLDEYRSWDLDAGGLVVCRPGFNENDDRHLVYVSELMDDITGVAPVVVHYDDKDTNKIEIFRKSQDRWMCAIRKVSEGVDIKRLRVLLMATCPSTELLFRQLVGRVIRVDDENRPGDAVVIMPKFPSLVEWAGRIAEEAEQGIRDRDEDDTRKKGDGDRESQPFIAIGASHEDGGATSDFGDQFNSAEIDAAEREKREDPQLFDIPITKIAYLMRKHGIKVALDEPPEEPLQIRKKRIRKEIVSAHRALAIKRNPSNPDFKGVFKDSITANFGARSMDDLIDNYSIDVMRQVLTLLKRLAGERDAAA